MGLSLCQKLSKTNFRFSNHSIRCTNSKKSDTVNFQIQQSIIPHSTCPCGESCPRCKEQNSTQSNVQKQILRQTGNANSTEDRAEEENILIPTEEDIIQDLMRAKSWVRNAADTFERYSRVIRLFAQDENLAYRINNIGTSRLRCALRDNFNLDPTVNSSNNYASRILEISSRLRTIRRILDRTEWIHFRIGAANDSRCESNVAGFVVGMSYPIYLCLDYFLLFGNAAPIRAAVIIHEVSHIAGLYDEEYIRSSSESLPDPQCFRNTRFSVNSSLTVRNPDSYAYFSADLRSQNQ